ncbi:DgyrCDS5814 [Dimorphilus gyrociliatus]|uniref:DgyrCDS5814 n=1 Tax=Dimorphilus gyrociliatus TaxID=2664684 RepID=A0A7I8VMM9_9ANNE|nr:DgyrCDS5814 [Dimorphilus gyrociliatus]
MIVIIFLIIVLVAKSVVSKKGDHYVAIQLVVIFILIVIFIVRKPIGKNNKTTESWINQSSSQCTSGYSFKESNSSKKEQSYKKIKKSHTPLKKRSIANSNAPESTSNELKVIAKPLAISAVKSDLYPYHSNVTRKSSERHNSLPKAMELNTHLKEKSLPLDPSLIELMGKWGKRYSNDIHTTNKQRRSVQYDLNKKNDKSRVSIPESEFDDTRPILVDTKVSILKKDHQLKNSLSRTTSVVRFSDKPSILKFVKDFNETQQPIISNPNGSSKSINVQKQVSTSVNSKNKFDSNNHNTVSILERLQS